MFWVSVVYDLCMKKYLDSRMVKLILWQWSIFVSWNILITCCSTLHWSIVIATGPLLLSHNTWCDRSSDRSCTRGKIHTKLHLISPGCHLTKASWALFSVQSIPSYEPIYLLKALVKWYPVCSRPSIALQVQNRGLKHYIRGVKMIDIQWNLDVFVVYAIPKKHRCM